MISTRTLKSALFLFALTFCFSSLSQLCEATLVGYRFDAYNIKTNPQMPYYTNGNLMGIVTEQQNTARGHLLNYDKWGISFIGVTLMMAPGSGWSPFYFADDDKNDRYNRGKEKGLFVGDWIAFGFGMGLYNLSETRYDNQIILSETSVQNKIHMRGNLDLGVIGGYRLKPDQCFGLRYYLTVGGWGLGKNTFAGLKLDLFGRYGRIAGRFGFGHKNFAPIPGFEKRKEIELSLYFLEVIRSRWSLNLKYNCLTRIHGEKGAINSFSLGIGFVLF